MMLSNALVLLLASSFSHLHLGEACAASGVCGSNPYCQGPSYYQPQPSYGLPPPPPPPPPPQPVGYRVPVCPSGCAPSRGVNYGCGPYGCYKMRAHGALSFQLNTSTTTGRRAPLSTDKLMLLEDDSKAGLKMPKKMVFGPTHPRIPQHEMDELVAASPSVAAMLQNPVPISPNRAFMECCLDRHLPDACLDKCHFTTYNKNALTQMFFKADGCPIEAMREIQFCAAQGQDHRECCARNQVGNTIAGKNCLILCDQRPGRVTQLDITYVPCFDRFDSMKACFWDAQMIKNHHRHA